jgi:hypothetical protein
MATRNLFALTEVSTINSADAEKFVSYGDNVTPSLNITWTNILAWISGKLAVTFINKNLTGVNQTAALQNLFGYSGILKKLYASSVAGDGSNTKFIMPMSGGHPIPFNDIDIVVLNGTSHYILPSQSDDPSVLQGKIIGISNSSASEVLYIMTTNCFHPSYANYVRIDRNGYAEFCFCQDNLWHFISGNQATTMN